MSSSSAQEMATNFEEQLAQLRHKARELGLKRIAIFGAPSGDDAAEIIASGLVAGNYRFDKYRADKDRKASLESVLINGSGGQGSDRGLKLGEARNLTRDLVNAPPAEVYPESLAAVCAELASDTMTVTIWDADKIKSEGMGGITAVGQGSSNPPVLFTCITNPKATLASQSPWLVKASLSMRVASASSQVAECRPCAVIWQVQAQLLV